MSRTHVVEVEQVIAATPEEIWAVVSDTSRYADWVDGCLEVTDHHGSAEVGKTYSERNRTVGPLTGRSVWTVLSQTEPSERIDRGEGLAPLQNLTNTFRFTPTADGTSTTMLYRVSFELPLGPLSPLVASVLGRGLRGEFARSMTALERLIRSERPAGA